MNNKNSDQAMSESFVLSNVAPQVGAGFNRDYWARFERFINDTVVPACRDVYVVTGPLYLEAADTSVRVGASLLPFEERSENTAITVASTATSTSTVKVPTHFYKVVLGELKDSARKSDGSGFVLGAFVMPNAQINPKTPLSSFQVPLAQLELVAGIDFFPNLTSSSSHPSSGLQLNQADLCGLNACQLPPEQFWLPAHERSGTTASEAARK